MLVYIYTYMYMYIYIYLHIQVEDSALHQWWAAIAHSLYADFSITWPDGKHELFHSPLTECPEPSFNTPGGRFLSNCTVNVKCRTLNFPLMCCSTESPLTGNTTQCEHGRKELQGNCHCSCEVGWTGLWCNLRHPHISFDMVLASMSERDFLAATQVQMRLAMGSFVGRPLYMIELDSFSDHSSSARRFVPDRKQWVHKVVTRQASDRKLRVRLRVLMSTERDCLRAAQVLVDGVNSGSLLLALQRKNLATKGVSFTEPPVSYDVLGRTLCDDVLYACDEDVVAKMNAMVTTENESSTINWLLICVISGLILAIVLAIMLCVYAQSKGYAVLAYCLQAVTFPVKSSRRLTQKFQTKRAHSQSRTSVPLNNQTIPIEFPCRVSMVKQRIVAETLNNQSRHLDSAQEKFYDKHTGQLHSLFGINHRAEIDATDDPKLLEHWGQRQKQSGVKFTANSRNQRGGTPPVNNYLAPRKLLFVPPQASPHLDNSSSPASAFIVPASYTGRFQEFLSPKEKQIFVLSSSGDLKQTPEPSRKTGDTLPDPNVDLMPVVCERRLFSSSPLRGVDTPSPTCENTEVEGQQDTILTRSSLASFTHENLPLPWVEVPRLHVSSANNTVNPPSSSPLNAASHLMILTRRSASPGRPVQLKRRSASPSCVPAQPSEKLVESLLVSNISFLLSPLSLILADREIVKETYTSVF